MNAIKHPVLLAAGWALSVGVAASAQDAPATPPSAPTVASARFASLPLREVAERLSRATGTLVVADKTVAAVPVTLNVGGETLDAVLQRVAKVLPEGALVKTVYLPAFAPTAPAPDADKIAALVFAQEALMAGGASKNGTAEDIVIQGKRLGPDKAASVVAALELKPVYLLTNPKAASDPVEKLGAVQLESLRTWLEMTPEQQKTAVDQQFDALINMDPSLRQQIFAQQRQVMQSFFQKAQALPEDQRAQFFREMTGGRWDGNRGQRGDRGERPSEPRQP